MASSINTKNDNQMVTEHLRQPLFKPCYFGKTREEKLQLKSVHNKLSLKGNKIIPNTTIGKLVIYVTNLTKNKNFKTTYSTKIEYNSIISFIEAHNIKKVEIKNIYFNNKHYDWHN
jgi:hypothetical protein